MRCSNCKEILLQKLKRGTAAKTRLFLYEVLKLEEVLLQRLTNPSCMRCSNWREVLLQKPGKVLLQRVTSSYIIINNLQAFQLIVFARYLLGVPKP